MLVGGHACKSFLQKQHCLRDADVQRNCWRKMFALIKPLWQEKKNPKTNCINDQMTGIADRSHPDRLRWRKCQKENPSLSTPSSDSMPLWSATGRSRSPSCPFWSFLGVITKGYVQRVSPAKRALVSKKKNNLCYVTHWCCCCCCCCLWQWSRRRKPEGGEERCQVKMTWTEGWREGWRKKGRGGVGWFAAAHELHRHDFCTLCTFISLSIHCYTEATQLTAAWHHWLLPPSH